MLGQVIDPPAQGVHTIHLCTLSKISSPRSFSAVGHFVPVSRPFYIVFSVRQQRAKICFGGLASRAADAAAAQAIWPGGGPRGAACGGKCRQKKASASAGTKRSAGCEISQPEASAGAGKRMEALRRQASQPLPAFLPLWFVLPSMSERQRTGSVPSGNAYCSSSAMEIVEPSTVGGLWAKPRHSRAMAHRMRTNFALPFVVAANSGNLHQKT